VLFGSFVFLESVTKKPLEWSYSYWKTHEKPFGAEIFHNIYTENLETTEEKEKSPYEVLTNDYISGNYLFFNEGLYFGLYDTKELICWIEDGNNLFLSAQYFPSKILDTLKLKKEEFVFNDQINYKPSVKLGKSNDFENYKFDRNQNVYYFKNTDSLDVEILGYTQVQNKDSSVTKTLPNFIKTSLGEGQIYLHLFPQAFTNFFLVDSLNAKYTEGILQDLDYDRTVYVDQYHKEQKEAKPQGLLKYLVSNKHLRWAYYLILLTGIIYVFFEGKRKQKPIKVLRPFENKTYEFTKTIAEMYYRKKDHKSIATKQIEHFFDYVREHYNISTLILNDEFVKQLSSKSGHETKIITALLRNIDRIEKKKNISKEELINLEKQISKLKT
jgi:hypothetical protein